jgi:hypothetical protein
MFSFEYALQGLMAGLHRTTLSVTHRDIRVGSPRRPLILLRKIDCQLAVRSPRATHYNHKTNICGNCPL